MRANNRVGDVSAAIQEFVESAGFYVTREYTGHGVGRQMHEGPQVPNYGTRWSGSNLAPGYDHRLGADGSGRDFSNQSPPGSMDGRLRRWFPDRPLGAFRRNYRRRGSHINPALISTGRQMH